MRATWASRERLAIRLRPLPADEVDDHDEDERHDEKEQAEGPQGVVVLGARDRVGEAGRERRRERGRRVEKTGGHGALDAADDHLDGERLAEGARHAEDDRSHERGHGALEDHVPGGLPAGAPEGV